MNPKDHDERARAATLGPRRSARSARRVFGEPYREGRTTIIPVATIRGIAHPDHRDAASDDPAGELGRGATIRPVGVYVISDDGVIWRPSVDVNQAIRGGQIIGAITVLATAYIIGRKLLRRT